ncbi:MAG: helix-turn-helix domain-containing protein [Candidatus Dojkabacteria bacterium]|nr:helix-turn-helix domain-containing protein [Candidatus Dojkabacteria bacterium]MDQ7020847.1 helix-turn-helix domain-containing protein [Candidatus Dojkabacteria bacterium]
MSLTNLRNELTNNEYIVLMELVKNEKISREKIGDLIWKANYESKHSDWAIDQLIKRIRLKLDGFGAKEAIITRKEYGYELSTKFI